ncbi:BgTH12-03473 [Blumeria graminis f. sp. triticale]|uniref:RNA polymerase II holoenzyme cyclin-like subunit n=4 Tax=Blumeria graminis TaxID=34373 RepID=A0A656KLL5_BLUGR|nr:Cyclin [Blumeria graminis f. sp. tritici 96224]CAD6499352.1 BgTH12-03473 [Blumeria graminis f. sp. triticale]VCU39475.1 Bgt-4475 [Blumeria graminis f. sp. tritici]
MAASSLVSEDERYQMSTQYKLWSFTSEALLELRSNTNRVAAERVREAVTRSRTNQNLTTEGAIVQKNSVSNNSVLEEEIDCLTVEEELKLVVFYCRQTIQLGDHLGLPSDVKATAIQYIKRFYITNSLMTYHPADILKTALFFATKTENFYFRLTKFADAIGKTTPEDVLASEFLLTQGLRFTFDVRHPYRALEGAIMELQAISKMGTPALPGDSSMTSKKPINMERRIKDAHKKARDYLKSSTLLTDVYFHFTPSQIMVSTLMISDEELTKWYIKLKFPGQEMQNLLSKVLNTIEKCAGMLKAIDPHSEPSTLERKELQGLAKKLKKCRNPEKMDLVGLQRAKREGDYGYGAKAMKKRKLAEETQQANTNDIFGPAIKIP